MDNMTAYLPVAELGIKGGNPCNVGRSDIRDLT
jgi:hypothetical protein